MYAQVYSARFGWSRAHRMNSKGDAHETLYLLFKIYDLPPNMVMYVSKEQILGLFRKKCQEVDSHIKQTEPYSPWKLQAEVNIRELKKGSGRKIFRAGAPKWI